MTITHRSYALHPDIRQIKTWLWIAGLASIVLGLAGIAFPFVVTLATELLFGAVLAALGVVQILRAVFSGDAASRIWTLIFGGIALIGGAFLLLYPLQGMLTLTALLASFFLAGGMAKLIGAWLMRPARARGIGLAEFPGRGWLVASGAVSLGLGAMLIIGLPATAHWALGLLLGIDLLFLGAAEIALAMGLAKVTHSGVRA